MDDEEEEEEGDHDDDDEALVILMLRLHGTRTRENDILHQGIYIHARLHSCIYIFLCKLMYKCLSRPMYIYIYICI